MRIKAGILLAAVCSGLLILLAAFSSRDLPPAEPAQPTEPAQAGTVAPEQRPTEEGPTEAVLERLPARIRDVTPAHVLPAPELTQEVIVRLPAVQAPEPPPRPPKPQRWPKAIVMSPGVIASQDTQIVLAGIEALGSDAMCKDEAGESWPCGNFARAALQRLIRQRSIECDPVEVEMASGEDRPAQVTTRCRIAGRDIGEWLVAQGWAKPLAGSGYDGALAEARQDGRGQWRGAGFN